MRKVGWILFLSTAFKTKVSAEEDEPPGKRLTREEFGRFFLGFFRFFFQ